MAYFGGRRRGLGRATLRVFLLFAIKHLHVHTGGYPGVLAELSLPLARAEQDPSCALRCFVMCYPRNARERGSEPENILLRWLTRSRATSSVKQSYFGGTNNGG